MQLPLLHKLCQSEDPSRNGPFEALDPLYLPRGPTLRSHRAAKHLTLGLLKPTRQVGVYVVAPDILFQLGRSAGMVKSALALVVKPVCFHCYLRGPSSHGEPTQKREAKRYTDGLSSSSDCAVSPAREERCSDRSEDATVVEPLHPFEGGELDLFYAPPGAAVIDPLGLV